PTGLPVSRPRGTSDRAVPWRRLASSVRRCPFVRTCHGGSGSTHPSVVVADVVAPRLHAPHPSPRRRELELVPRRPRRHDHVRVTPHQLPIQPPPHHPVPLPQRPRFPHIHFRPFPRPRQPFPTLLVREKAVPPSSPWAAKPPH